MVVIKRFRFVVLALLVLGALVALGLYLHGSNIAIFNPKGPIARQEEKLIVLSLLLSLIVVVPVFIMVFSFAWKYREGNNAKYSPELDHNRLAETIWWLVPTALISVLAVIAWNSSHSLDPYKPLVSSTPPLTIQVVALDWKWLFIYPQQRVASVNFVQIPERTPVNFVITADAPMNSFWIPQLAGQIYAMPGMSTQLHLSADGLGSYNGLSANISGEGFSGMTFVAKSSTKADFNDWIETARRSSQRLTMDQYNQLVKPTQNNRVVVYSAPASGLYGSVIDKYMVPGASSMSSSMPGMVMQ
jgi:cytochrome o ubiquinol oxidase subunit 2